MIKLFTEMSEIKEPIKTSDKVKFALSNQGRKKTWLADQLGISRPTLDNRLKDNSFLIGEIMKLQELGIL